MTIACMRALAAHDIETAGREIGATVSRGLDEDLADFLRFRLAQVEADPSVRQWLGRLMLLDDEDGERRAIGTIGFHGAPDELGRLEVGYRVEAPYRRHGYAREALRAMFDWASETHGIHRFIASVSPTNAPSLRLIDGFGFVETGSHMDEIDGLEIEFETDWPRPA